MIYNALLSVIIWYLNVQVLLVGTLLSTLCVLVRCSHPFWGYLVTL